MTFAKDHLVPILIASVVFFLASCKKDKETDCYEKESSNVSYGFESTLEHWVALGGGGERASDGDIEITNELSFSGQQSVKFTVSPSSYVNSGVRSELTFDPQIEEGDEITWEYSVYFPADYQDVHLYDSLDRANWQVIGQWHDQPDECIGQTWSTLPSQSPPIGIYYSFLSSADPAYETLMSEAGESNVYGFDSTWDNVPILNLVYNNESIAVKEIAKGEWIHLKFQTKWSTANDGFIQGWINDEAFTDGVVHGRNMWNKASHYFKFGLYRNPTILHTNCIYYDDIRVQ